MNKTKLVETFQDLVNESQETGVMDLSKLLSEFSKNVAADDIALMEFEERHKGKKGFFK